MVVATGGLLHAIVQTIDGTIVPKNALFVSTRGGTFNSVKRNSCWRGISAITTSPRHGFNRIFVGPRVCVSGSCGYRFHLSTEQNVLAAEKSVVCKAELGVSRCVCLLLVVSGFNVIFRKTPNGCCHGRAIARHHPNDS